MRILVVGGAGYIGSHMVKLLTQKKYDVLTIDNLSTGHRDAVVAGDFMEGDLGNTSILDAVFEEHQIDGVMHFASFIQVAESVQNPSIYYRNNVSNTQNLLDAMVRHDIKKFIFSSTAAIFGEPEYMPIDELHPKHPINPYGRTKLMVEEMLRDYDKAYGLRSISLRYFNAAGADPDGQLGERHDPETHLIPLVLQVASERREAISVFGRDYDTSDGTCIRDYIHIMDLCQAHLLAMEKLVNGAASDAYNLGNGTGYSVQEVVDVVRKITGKNIKIMNAPRREGDPAVLVADSKRARLELGWEPEFGELETIVQHAWLWEQMHFTEN